MKKATFYSFVVCLVLSAIVPSQAVSAPIGNSNWARDYLVSANDLSRLTAGAYFDTIERGVDMDGTDLTLKSDRIMAYVSYSVLPWLVPYVTIGAAESDLEGRVLEYSDDTTAYGCGVALNLMDHDILDPMLLEDRIRVRSSIDYLRVTTTDGGDDADWNEFRADLTVGLINDVAGNKRFLPQSIEIFIGPVYSAVTGDIESREDFGYVAGISLHCTERITIDAAVEDTDDASVFAGVHLRL